MSFAAAFPDPPADAFTPPDAEALEKGHSRFTTGLDTLCQPDHDAPDPQRHPNYRPLLEAKFSRVESVRGLLLARGRDGALVTPLVARGPVVRDSRPTYRGSTSRVLGEIDLATAQAAWADNSRLRRERDAAMADAVREESLRQEVQVRLVQAETDLEAAQARIAELKVTVTGLGRNLDAATQAPAVVGEVIVHVDAHAAGHDKGGVCDD